MSVSCPWLIKTGGVHQNVTSMDQVGLSFKYLVEPVESEKEFKMS